MLKANPNYRSIVYSSVVENQFTELVRVERHSRDATTIRAVPRSRLNSGSTNPYLEAVTTKMPEEVHTSLVDNPMCDPDKASRSTVGLLAGVPVYDQRTEEVFGYVVINYDINQMLRDK